jgi:hypothetical protein
MKGNDKMPEPYYTLFLQMWVMHEITIAQLQTAVTKGKISQAEYDTIISTAQE